MRSHVAAAVLALLLSAGCRQGTFLRVTVEAIPSLTATALDVTVGNDGSTSDGRVARDGAPFTFPQTFYVSFDQGRSGPVTIEVIAKDGTTEVARAKADAVLAPGNTVELAVMLTSPAIPDMSSPDLAPRPAVSFAPPRSYATNTFPLGLVVGDVDNNAQPDIVVACETADVIAVLLNTGRGEAFAQHVDFLVGGRQPGAPLLTDFDSDGSADVVVALAQSDSVAVLWGNGKGAFSAPSTWAANGRSFPVSTAVGDFNGDGRWDFATNDARLEVRGVAIYTNEGSRRFSVHSYATDSANGLLARDLNLDGRADLILSGSGIGIGVALASADGGLDSPAWFASGKPARGRLAFGSWTKGRYADVAVAGLEGIELFPNRDAGVYDPSLTISGPTNATLAAADFNSDGEVDLAYTKTGAGVLVVVSEGLGKFTAPLLVYPSSEYPDIAVGDVNGDGQPDLVASNAGAATVSVLVNTSR